jgi:hexosaminidase
VSARRPRPEDDWIAAATVVARGALWLALAPLLAAAAVAGCASNGSGPTPPDALVADDGGGGGSPDGGVGGPDLAAPPLPPCPSTVMATLDGVVPRPLSTTAAGGVLCLPSFATVAVAPDTPALRAVGEALAARLRPATGYAWPVVATSGAPARGQVYLTTDGADAALGAEGYTLTITDERVELKAPAAAGLFYGAQTLRQLLPATIERAGVQSGPWPLATGSIRDQPRFGWRGFMLDVARHFFAPPEVERYIDLMAYYKLNRLHLHLTDDQGWRLALAARPELARIGGSTQVGGATGAFYYSAAEYDALVAYAAARQIVVVPELDMPGHTNAALASYAELNCNGTAVPLYTGTAVGFSSLCIGTAATQAFVAAVIDEVARHTPGPWLHLGGDEASATSAADYKSFMGAVAGPVSAAGKTLVGWADIARTPLAPTALAQHWDPNRIDAALAAVKQHVKLIMSPASRIYLDMKYDLTTPLGQFWAGFVDEQRAYDWDPATELPGVGEGDLAGVEAPLWTETLVTRADLDVMAFPRLVGVAEIGWSPRGRSWAEYRTRVATHGPRLEALGVQFHRSSKIPWP